jgi:hypothetical protein
MLYNSGVKLLYYSQDDLQCPTETAQSVALTGLKDNSTGQQEKLAKTKTLTLSSVADFLPRRLRDA